MHPPTPSDASILFSRRLSRRSPPDYGRALLFSIAMSAHRFIEDDAGLLPTRTSIAPLTCPIETNLKTGIVHGRTVSFAIGRSPHNCS